MTAPARTTPPARRLRGYWLGRRPYGPIHELMQNLHGLRRRGEVEDLVLLLEHEPVITLGRGAKARHLLWSEAELVERGVTVEKTGRGGDVTLHAPGQLIAYPIVDLSPDRQDVRRYVQGLTRVMQGLVASFGIEGGTMDQMIGLWVDAAAPDRWPGQQHVRNPKKIGAIGVRISRWVTGHGFALNVHTDLSLFRTIVPCGISEHGVTSIQAVLSARQANERPRANEVPAPDSAGIPSDGVQPLGVPECAPLATEAHQQLAQELGAEATAFFEWDQLPTEELTAERIQRSFGSPAGEAFSSASRVATNNTLLGEP